MRFERRLRSFSDRLPAIPLRLFDRPAPSVCSRQRDRARCLIRERSGRDAALQSSGNHLCRIADQADAILPASARLVQSSHRFIEVVGRSIQISRLAAAFRCVAFDIDRKKRTRHGRRPAAARRPSRQGPRSESTCPASRRQMLAARLREGFVCALNDSLRADVDPGAGRHLAVHHQPLAIEFVEMFPGRPFRHEV